jgi:hypothetical protein
MRMLTTVILLTGIAGFVRAEPPPPVNFNLVQVNNYYNHPAAAPADSNAQRVVIDLSDPAARAKFTGAGVPVMQAAPVMVRVERNATALSGGVLVPWETHTILHAEMGNDSFRVSSSRSGCPGTEVRPSVAVAFPAHGGWSDPPIRFGPLGERALCPLGKGYQLEVSVSGDGSPLVKLHEPMHEASRR